MSTLPTLLPLCKKLRLSGMLQSLELRLRQAVDDDWSHVEFLHRLLADEVERRDARQLEQRLRRAGFTQGKSLDAFEWTFNPRVPKAKLLDLATCAFVARHENVILLGPTGTGKTMLAEGLGERACRAGYTVTEVTATQLGQQLRAARADESYERRLLRFTTPDVLIIDDLGLRPWAHPDAPGDFYEVIRQRYERGSILVTSNRAIEEWPPLFGDALLASAALDRLLHHAHVLTLEGDSYRNPPPGRRGKEAEPA